MKQDAWRQGQPLQRWRVLALLAVPVVGLAILATIFSLTRPGDTKDQPVKVELLPTPAFPHYPTGQLVQFINAPANLFCVDPAVDQEQTGRTVETFCSPLVNVFAGEYVAVLGQPQYLYFDDSEGLKTDWYWPVRGVQAGYEVEGHTGWILATAPIYPVPRVESREEPHVVAGETVLMSVGYSLHVGTSLQSARVVDANGMPVSLIGGDPVTLSANTEPVLAADGHWWCDVIVQGIYEGWVPCEFERL